LPFDSVGLVRYTNCR